ncbi:InlB B-repeat-containing protein [Candidatus Saccharibacteria bacterium]|nr:InlB B-repeat-containing protein [Candidatus Saccharibacteria bacterium]
MKKSSARLSLIACLLIICALFILSQPTMSLSSSTTINVVFEFEKTLQLTVSDPEMIIENLLPGTSDNTNEISVNVATNSETGFIMDAAVGERLRPSTRIPNIIDGETYFSSVGLNKKVTSIPAGQWGYSIDHGATYSGLPDYRDVHPSDIFIESHEAANMSLPFLVGATSADDQARGIYYTPITFRAVTRPTVPTIDTILYMQEMDETIYESMKTEKQYQLMDKRDGKMYFISKLKDGNVWMTQNLDFDLYDGITLDPETSDVKVPTTMDLTPLGQNQGRSEHYYYYDNYMFDQGNYYCPDGFCYRTSDLASLDNLEPTDKENHYALGNRYSYAAATANYFPQCPKYEVNSGEYDACRNRYNSEYSGKDSETSICPAGWTLPSSNSQNGLSVKSLGVAIGFPKEYSSYSGNYALFLEPLFFVGNGYAYVGDSYFNDYTNNGYNYAYYWTSTVSGSYYAYYIYSYLYTTSRTDPATGNSIYYPYGGYLSTSTNTYSLYYLLPLRCAARAPQYTVEYYMNENAVEEPYATWKSVMAWSGNNTVKPSNPSRAGYRFLGWGTSPKTVEARYEAGSTIKLDSYHTKLYAAWEKLDDDDMMEGSYTFEAVLRRAGKTTVDGYYNIQDIDSEICSQVDIGEKMIVRDSRDGKLYEIAKDKLTADAKFGTCWMHDDLRLGSTTDSYTLTSEDSDVESDYVLPAVSIVLNNYNNFQDEFIMDNNERIDSENGKLLGYNYNYDVITAGYYAAHTNISGQQTSTSSICPKNWTLPRDYDQNLLNSEKRIWDVYEPVKYINSEYYSYDTNYNIKIQNIMYGFIGRRTLSNRGPSYTTDRTLRASKDYYGSSFYVTENYRSGSTFYLRSNSYERRYYSAMVRCMIPVDYNIKDITITYNLNYSGPNGSSSYTQMASADASDTRYFITIEPPTITTKRPGWQLAGWSERSGATVPDYMDGDIMETTNSNTYISLYAVWKRIGNSNVTTFDEAFEAARKTKHGDYYAMQDITPEICDAVSDGQQGRLIDLRDNKVYWVGRLTSVYDTVHEGECWMTQNLDFELSLEETGTRLYPETSDVEEEMVVRSDIRDADAANIGYMSASDFYFPDGGLRFNETRNNAMSEYYDALAPVSELEKDDERWHYHLGSYYSWSSAMVFNDIANIDQRYQYAGRSTSICPQGWKMPVYNYNNYTDRSFNALLSYILPSTNYGYSNYYTVDPFYPTLGGYIYPSNGSNTFETMVRSHSIPSDFGTHAIYWTANTSSTNRNAYYYRIYFSGINSSSIDNLKNRYYSSYTNSENYVFYLNSVRCVAR